MQISRTGRGGERKCRNSLRHVDPWPRGREATRDVQRYILLSERDRLSLSAVFCTSGQLFFCTMFPVDLESPNEYTCNIKKRAIYLGAAQGAGRPYEATLPWDLKNNREATVRSTTVASIQQQYNSTSFTIWYLWQPRYFCD